MVGGIHRGALHRGREVAAGISHLTDKGVVVNGGGGCKNCWL